MLTGKRILTVAASPVVSVWIHSLLTARGDQVLNAESGIQALQHHSAEPFDLILLDLLLPDQSGIEILQQMRATDQQATILMLIGAGDVRTAIAAVRAGADGFIEKEGLSTKGDEEELVYKLQQALQRRQGLVAQAELEEMKADFYAMVTHDLRNPASTISIALEMLQDPQTGPLNDLQQEIVATIQEGTGRLLHLINNYLDLSLWEAGKFDLTSEPVDLRQIVESCVRMAGLPAQSKELDFQQSITPHPSFTIWGDAERLRRLFDNLISNAIKYTPSGGWVKVRLDRNDEGILFQVTDSGYGFEAEAGKLLFRKYGRLPTLASRSASGTGLGLVIAQKIANAHGGFITAHSDGVNLGAQFTVMLPDSPEAAMSLRQKAENLPQRGEGAE